jgi:anti-sigma regulatory factor (Ser/Thr protein kinase)
LVVRRKEVSDPIEPVEGGLKPAATKEDVHLRHVPSDLAQRLNYLASTRAHQAPRRLPELRAMESKPHVWTFVLRTTDVDHAGSFAEKLGDKLEGLLDDSAFSGVRISLREIAINAVLHGNLGITHQDNELGSGALKALIEARRQERRHLVVTIEERRTEDEISWIIRDQGEGFEEKEVPDPVAPQNILKSHGRGLLMARAYFDEVKIEKNMGTQVTLIKRLPKKDG